MNRRTLLAAAGYAASALAFSGVVAGWIPSACAAAPAGGTMPQSPRRIAALDYALLDMLISWGETRRLAAAADPSPLGYLRAPEGIPLTGGLKSAPLELLERVEPDLIVISGRLSAHRADLERIAPVALFTPDQTGGAVASFVRNLRTAAAWTGREADAEALAASVEARVAKIAAKAAGDTAAVLMVNEGRVGMLAPGGRCSMISREFGFTNVLPPRKGAAPKKGGPKPDAEALREANRKTMHDLLRLDPKHVFILNKDRAVGREAVGDHRALLGDGWERLPAVRAGRVRTLADSAWYLGEGGPSAMELMLRDAERALAL